MTGLKKIASVICSGILASTLLVSCGSRTGFSSAKGFIPLQSFSVETEGVYDINIESTEFLEDETESGLSEYTASTYKFVQASFRKVFDEYDTNHNGTVDLSELSEAPNAFKKMDKNKDERLTFTEARPSTTRINHMAKLVESFYKDIYELADKNSDGELSVKELNSSEELEPFRSLPLWNKSMKSISTGNRTGTIKQKQFNIMMNHLFLTLSEKYANYKPSRYSSNGKSPVVLVQGYGEPSWYFLYGIYNNLRKNGWEALYPVNLFPNITDITEQARIVAKKIEQAKREQGVSKVDYVAHSMGGLIGRYYIQELNGARSIDHYISIASPHYGTYAAYLGIGDAAKQMKPGSQFLSELNAGNPIAPNIKYTSMWTKTDELVIPADNAKLRGSAIMPPVNFSGHLLILWVPEAYKQIRTALTN